jgi:membrane-bound lytic murein transglycosylase B
VVIARRAVLVASLVWAGSSAGEPAGFAACVRNLESVAVASGISEATAKHVLGGVRHLERVIELDRTQPEFVRTFGEYYRVRVTASRVADGRRLLRENAALLRRLQRDYGIPGHYLVALWGLETNFGSYFGNMSTMDSLTTLACDERRSAFFTTQLMDALRIVDDGDMEPEAMQGSWAGAMGHVQFMPSVFRRYAVDDDGDGRRDLWTSRRDALASAANYLKQAGWQPGFRWGREVRLPGDFDYAAAAQTPTRPLKDWVAAGVRNAFGGRLASADLPATLRLPSGHRGPAFLTYPNFEVIMEWNRSESYALSVGNLADRIAGRAPLEQPPPDNEPKLTPESVSQLQADLNTLGFDAGEADGVIGPATRAAIGRFQISRGLIADGYPDRQLLDALRASREAAEPTTSP